MAKRKKLPGHYCWSCDRRRPNERFSGRGHARHVCKDCAKLGRDELAYRQAVRNIDRMVGWDGRIRRKQRESFARFLTHPDARTRAYAAQVAANDARTRESFRLAALADQLAWEREAPVVGLAQAVAEVIDLLRTRAASRAEPDTWERIVRVIAEHDSLPGDLELIDQAIAAASLNWSDAERRAIWRDTETCLRASEGDPASDTTLDIEPGLQAELLDAVLRAAWQDAEDECRGCANDLEFLRVGTDSGFAVSDPAHSTPIRLGGRLTDR